MKKNSFRRSQGQSLAEYALILALIAIACMTGLNALASGINTQLSSLGAAIGGGGSGSGATGGAPGGSIGSGLGG